MKNIEDYLHLYLGCDLLIEDQLVVQLVGFEQNGRSFYPVIRNKKNWDKAVVNDLSLIQLSLRPLSDMTDEEKYKLQNMVGALEYHHFKNDGICSPIAFRFLLSKHFDLFNLIPEGLAIDKTKL